MHARLRRPFVVAILAVPLLASHAPRRSPPTISMTMSLATLTVASGNTVVGSVTLSAAAPIGGTAVTLTSPKLAIAGFVSPTLGPSSQVATLTLVVPQGASTAKFSVLASVVAAPSAVTLQATSIVGLASATLTVNPATVKSVTVAPTLATGGKPASVTITLDGRASLSTGAQVALSSTVAAFPVPATITVSPNASSVTVSVTPSPVSVRSVGSLTAQSTGSSFTGVAATTSFGVVPPVPTAVQLNPTTVFGGFSSTGTVILNGPAAAGGRAVTLTSSSRDVIPPATVTVPQGLDRQTFVVATNAVSLLGGGTISASIPTVSGTTTTFTDGSSNTIQPGATPSPAAAALTVFPAPQLQSIAATPAPVTGGDSVAIVVTWSQVLVGTLSASGTSTPPPAVAQLSTNHPELVLIPSTIALNKLPAVQVRGTTAPPSVDQSVLIAATFGSQSVSATLLIKKPIPPIATFSLRPTTVSGGSVIAQFTLDSRITTPVTVRLKTDHPELVSLPASITVSPSSVPASFTFATSKPSSKTPVTITATAGVQTISATLTAVP